MTRVETALQNLAQSEDADVRVLIAVVKQAAKVRKLQIEHSLERTMDRLDRSLAAELVLDRILREEDR